MLKKLFVFIFLTTIIYASDLEKVIFVENKDNKEEISLVNEFFNQNTNYYTLSVAVLTTNKHNPIDFFKRNKLTNALAYKFGKNLEYIRIISGVYTSYDEAKDAIKNLRKSILRNSPYPIKIKRHQNQFRVYNNNSNTITVPKTKIKTKSFIYTSGSTDSEELKKELLKEDESKLYSISIATLPSSKNKVKIFFENNSISDKALAHVYGEKRDKVRVVYGLYKNYSEAKEAIKELNNSLRRNKPYPMKMKYFQNFYKKSNKNIENIVQLKINSKKSNEESSSLNIKDETKPVKEPKVVNLKNLSKELPKRKVLRKTVAKKIEVKKKIKKINKVKKIRKTKVIKNENPNENRYLKHSEYEDIYYIESKGSFNILNEVFLNDGSSFFTIDLGEIKLSEKTMEKFFLENNIANDALSYKYGDKKEYARAIYGAYETEEDAKGVIKELNFKNKDLKVTNIKNHQNLFKTYHENILKRKVSSKPKEVHRKKSKNKNAFNKPNSDSIVYVNKKDEKSLKEEFFNENTSFYTITLITFHKNDLNPEDFIFDNNIDEDLLAFSLGSNDDYYRIIYGVFKTSREALQVIEKLDNKLLKNKPYVSRLKTSRKRFESYNGRKVLDYKNLAREIALK